MRRKASVLRLSPNEEAQLVREELESRRKLRLQQVREQERYIARQVRRQVEERRQQQLQMLSDSLQLEWQQQRTLKLQALSTLYQHSLETVGDAHRSAHDNEPDLEALAEKSVERQERAEERHREALRELSARRHEEEQQRCRLIEARRKALVEEKKRAVRVASLPPPPPNPVESIGKPTPRPLRAAAELFSVTHCHMPSSAVDRETHTEQQPSARQAAALELQRLEDLRREAARERQEQLEKARLRGTHALRREQHTQDRVRLLSELERLQTADLLRRRQAVHSVPAQIFQPLYRHEELRDEQQRELEIAFQDVYTQERKVKGDVVLQLVPEPLPPLSAASHDEELDVTLDPECTPEGEETPSETASGQPIREQHGRSAATADPGRHALRRLLDRIRSQRDRQRAATLTSHDGDDDVGVSSVETGSLSSQEKAPEASLEEQTPSLAHTDDGPDVSDEAVVAGTLLPPEERGQPEPASAESQRRAAHEAALLRRQEEQLAVLEELEQKRRELEQRLRETQRSHTLQDDEAQSRPGLPESAAPPEDELHTQRLHQYQQRLLQQNRLHQKSVEEARRRLQEYQHTLKLRASLQQASVSSETLSDGTRSALPGGEPAGPLPALPQALLRPPEPVGSEPSLDARTPLPAPAVVLELLRSRPHPADVITGVESGVEETRRHMRRQRDALQALITADTQASVSSSSGAQADHMTLNTLLKTIEEANGHTRPPTAPIQRDGDTPALANDGVCEPARVRVKPPVSRAPARLAFLGQMQQHELSAIQEVDSPLNISLDTELRSSSADVRASSSASLPALASAGSHSLSERSQVTGRTSRMSWRDMLLQDSTSSPGPCPVTLQQERFSTDCPSSVDPDYLSSTTISTGSYFTSEHEPEDSGLSVDPDPTADTSRSVQRIIDRYSQELNASLTRAGAADGSPAGQSWSSALRDGDAHVSAPGAFLPLHPHPDVDTSSSSSSSSRNAVRADQSRQGWSEAVTRILERLSDQLSIRPGEPPSEASSERDRASDSELLQSAVSQLIGTASDMGSSQVFDQSSACAAAVVSSSGPDRPADVGSLMSPASLHSDEDRNASTDAPRDDASDLFLPLPSDVTNNESVDCSTALCVPLEAEKCGTDASVDEASDWLNSTDQSLQLLRADALTPPRADLQMSVEQLSLSHESLCENHDMDASLVPRSPLQTRLQKEILAPAAQLPSQEVMSAVEENTLSELLERAQAAGDVKGILEESTISFISLPESTLQDLSEDLGSEPQEGTSDCREGQAQSRPVEDDSQSEEPEPSFPHAALYQWFSARLAMGHTLPHSRQAARPATHYFRDSRPIIMHLIL
ncbi:uncharacterized protein cep295 isoform X2 [Pimephales promelas]|uniref:uncharacterized protein cep295 isoform X2 n=1 Tax=Pimephales promelas TaxID=90988 RepID=UPI001955AB14|nr:uncharacterized protein cep295 isoform X2 [Pimephales promelas]